jgi:hypothetical protein
MFKVLLLIGLTVLSVSSFPNQIDYDQPKYEDTEEYNNNGMYVDSLDEVFHVLVKKGHRENGELSWNSAV